MLGFGPVLEPGLLYHLRYDIHVELRIKLHNNSVKWPVGVKYCNTVTKVLQFNPAPNRFITQRGRMAKQSPLNGQRYTRPLAKCVDVKKIRDWIPEEARRRVDITSAWTIIKNHYCAALVGRGVCPIECGNCREEIISLFGLKDAKNPEALLTWRAKDRSAVMIEELIAAQKREPANKFPAMETDPDPLASLFSQKKVGDNLFLEMDADYL